MVWKRFAIVRFPQKSLDEPPQRAYTHLPMRLSSVLLFVCLNLTPGFALAASLNTICLNTELAIITNSLGGHVGICVTDGQKGGSVNGTQRFPLYNIVELPVAVAVLDAVDRGHIHLHDLATVPGNHGSKATVQDLLVRMIENNDRSATDSLITTVGGPRAVENVLVTKKLQGFRIARNEPDPHSLSSTDPNTGTPLAVANLLQWLINGVLVSPQSSSLLLETMGKTHAYSDRLRAGLPAGWLIAHKSGTGANPKGGINTASDVGILMAPDARSFVVAVVFIANSQASAQDQAKLIASVARAVGNCFQ
jgi:beta-lactamase class A